MFSTACQKPGPVHIFRTLWHCGSPLVTGVSVESTAPELMGPQCADTAKGASSSPASLHVVTGSRGCSWAIFDPVMRQGFPADKMSL